jgi:hypothetical protein
MEHFLLPSILYMNILQWRMKGASHRFGGGVHPQEPLPLYLPLRMTWFYYSTMILQHGHGTVWRNFEIASQCFHPSRPTTTYSQLDLTSSEDLTQLDVQNNTLYCLVLWIHYTSLFFQSNWVRSSEMLSPTHLQTWAVQHRSERLTGLDRTNNRKQCKQRQK